MSLLAVQGGATGTGTVTLLAPVTNTNRTLTLPDATGTVLTNATTTGFPAGSVLQVVTGTTSTLVSNNTNVPVDTGLTATITPTSASSKILILVSQNGIEKSTTNTYALLRLMRNATQIQAFEGQLCYTGTTATNSAASSTNYLDSPATTSATTYKTQITSGNNTATVAAQTSSSISTITLMEIAA